MVEKVIKVICALAVVALLVSIVYEPEMPDLLKRANINPDKVSAETVEKKFNQKYYDYCEEIRAYLEQINSADLSKGQMKKHFDRAFAFKPETEDIEYSVDDQIAEAYLGRVLLTTNDNMYDDCYEERTVDSDVVDKGLDVNDYDLVIKDHIIYWYCKKDGDLATVSPYHLYEADWVVEMDRIMPGLCDWFKSLEDQGVDAMTKDGQKVKVLDYNTLENNTITIQGVTVYYTMTEVDFEINGNEIYDIPGISEVKEALVPYGWGLEYYFIDGMDKGFVANLKLGRWNPTARVIVKDAKITGLEIDYADYNIIEKENLDFYQKGLAALFRTAGIDDSVKDVLNGEGKQSNYKVYTKAGEKETEEVAPDQYEEFDRFMVVIYDIQ